MPFLPSLSGDEENLKLLVPQHVLEEVTAYVSITGEENEYQDYFEYVQRTLELHDPENESLLLFID